MVRYAGLAIHLLLAAALATLALLAPNVTAPVSAAGATLTFPTATCVGPTSATVNLAWAPMSGVTSQWVDVSTQDNGFAPGTFAGAGPFASNANAYVWQNATPGKAHFWRVNSLTPAGWVTSSTGSFVPCGGPTPLATATKCVSFTVASADLRWAPMATGGATVQFIDLAFDPDFGPGFATVGPLQPSVQTYRWDNLMSEATYYYRVTEANSDGVWTWSPVASFSAPCTPSYTTEIYGSADFLMAPRLGIRAPVNVRDVPPDGNLGNPSGGEDVVRYNFNLFPTLGGYPGNGGTTVIGGHVDFSNRLAVFAPLRNVREGDELGYQRADGTTVTYVVDWFSDLDPYYAWSSLMTNTGPETLLLITCNGEFNSRIREYTHRRAVHAVKKS